MTMDTIKIRGARTHNLRNIDLDLPRDRLILELRLQGESVSEIAEELKQHTVHTLMQQ